MRDIDRQLWMHIAECLGIEKRSITRMVLTFDINEIATIETTELTIGGTGMRPQPHTRKWELKKFESTTTS